MRACLVPDARGSRGFVRIPAVFSRYHCTPAVGQRRTGKRSVGQRRVPAGPVVGTKQLLHLVHTQRAHAERGCVEALAARVNREVPCPS